MNKSEKNYENRLSYIERIQRFVTYSKAKKHPIILLIITVLLLATLIISDKLYDAPYIDPSAVTLNTPDNTAVQMSFVGDIMTDRNIKIKASNEGYDAIFKDVSPLWKDSDVVMGNLECVILQKDESAYQKNDDSTFFNGKPITVKTLKDSGFNLIGLANNHLRNYGPEGMRSTFEVFKEYGLEYVGAGNNMEEASACSIKEINGFKIGFIAATDFIANEGAAGENAPGSFSNHHDSFYDIVNDASQETDLTVVFMHFGSKNTFSQTESATEIAHRIIDAGADVVIGSHPHVVLPIEKYRDGIICYSIGNFVFDQGIERQTESTLINYTVTKNGEGQMEFIPIKLVNGFPRVAVGKSAINRINHYLTKNLSDTDYRVTDSGHILISAPGINLNEVKAREKEEKAEQTTTATTEESTEESTENSASSQ